jgi:hypothetical protein
MGFMIFFNFLFIHLYWSYHLDYGFNGLVSFGWVFIGSFLKINVFYLLIFLVMSLVIINDFIFLFIETNDY